jgi:hypothetical protein
VERWCQLFGGDIIVDRWRSGELLCTTEEIVVKTLIDIWRKRMYDLGWFMVAPAQSLTESILP